MRKTEYTVLRQRHLKTPQAPAVSSVQAADGDLASPIDPTLLQNIFFSLLVAEAAARAATHGSLPGASRLGTAHPDTTARTPFRKGLRGGRQPNQSGDVFDSLCNAIVSISSALTIENRQMAALTREEVLHV